MYLFLEILNILHVLSKSKLLCKEGEIFGEDLNFAILVESINQQCILEITIWRNLNTNKILFGLKTTKFSPNEYMCFYNNCNPLNTIQIVI